MAITEAAIETKVDTTITQYQTTPIRYYPFEEAVQPDLYKQRSKVFGLPVTIIGRAIHKPTPEMVTVIGDGEFYDVAFVFSRLEMVRKFPAADEGEWLKTSGEMEWRNRRYKIEKVAPAGQVGVHFALVIALARTVEGYRDLI